MIVFWIEDGFYPKLKSYDEFDQKDVEKLMSTDKLDQLGDMIKNIK